MTSIRVNTLERTTDYVEGGALPAEVLNDDLDRVWLALQDVRTDAASLIEYEAIQIAVAADAASASTSATAAAGSASAAAASEAGVAASAASASASASAASASATNASNSATAAATSATNAGTSETNAGASATAAAGSASTASTAATNASNSASTASTAATNASNSATAAAGSATAAAGSASAAAASAAAITIPTGIVLGNGTAFSAAVAGTDYLAPAAIGTTVQGYDAATVKKNAANTFTATQTPDNGTASVSTTSTYTFDGADQIREVTLTNAITVTFGAPSGITQYAYYTFLLKAGDTSARTFAWNSAYKFPSASAPVTSGTTTSGSYDVITFIGGASNTLIYVGHQADVR